MADSSKKRGKKKTEQPAPAPEPTQTDANMANETNTVEFLEHLNESPGLADAAASELAQGVQRALSFAAAEQWDEALAEVAKLQQVDPQNPQLFALTGHIHRQSGQYELAIQQFDQAIRLDSEEEQFFIERSLCWVELKDFDKTLADLQQAELLAPGTSEIHIFRAMCFRERQDYDEAVAELQKAIELAPTEVEPHRLLGEIRTEMGQSGESVLQHFRQVVALQPESAENQFLLGIALLSADQDEPAITALQEALRLAEANGEEEIAVDTMQLLSTTYLTQQRATEAEALARRAKEIDPKNGMLPLIHAQALVMLGREDEIETADRDHLTVFHQVIERFEEILEKPAYNELRTELFNLELSKQREDYQAAVKICTQLLAKHPQLAEFYVERGECYWLLDAETEALADYTQAIELNPQLASAYSGRARLYLELEEPIAALSDLETAIQLDPEDDELYTFRAQALSLLPNPTPEQHQEILDNFEEAIRLAEEKSYPHFHRGVYFAMNKQWDQALADFQIVQQQNPEFEPLYYNLGLVQIELDDYQGALVSLTQAHEIDSEDGEVLFLRGRVYFELEQYDHALTDFNGACQRDPEVPENYFWRAKTYLARNQIAAARKDLDRAQKKGMPIPLVDEVRQQLS